MYPFAQLLWSTPEKPYAVNINDYQRFDYLLSYLHYRRCPHYRPYNPLHLRTHRYHRIHLDFRSRRRREYLNQNQTHHPDKEPLQDIRYSLEITFCLEK